MLYLALCDDSKDDLQEIMMCLGELKKKITEWKSCHISQVRH